MGRTYDIVCEINGKQYCWYGVPVEYQIEDLLALAFPNVPVKSRKL